MCSCTHFYFRSVKIMDLRKMLSELKLCLYKFDYIVFAILFGSQATGYETSESDVDVAIYPNRDLSVEDKIELIYQISKCLGIPEDKIDILILSNALSLELRYKIFRDGILIFARDERIYKKFRDLSISLYLDYKIALDKVKYGEKYLKKTKEMLNGVKREI